MNDVIELSIAKMLRHGVPRNEAEIAAPIYLEGCLLQYQEGATRREEGLIGIAINSALRNDYANCGHMPFFEMADRFNQDVADFVNSARRPRAFVS